MSIQHRGVYKKIVSKVVLDPRRVFFINSMLVCSVLFTLVFWALLVNHVNTMSLRLTDATHEESRLSERNSELKAHISELQTLGAIEKRAIELGMIAVNEYTFLSSSQTVVAQR